MSINQLGDGSADGVQVAVSGAKVGFYGTTPVVQRATATTHTTTNVVSSSAFASTGFAQLVAAVQEIQNTLIAIGIWAA